MNVFTFIQWHIFNNLHTLDLGQGKITEKYTDFIVTKMLPQVPYMRIYIYIYTNVYVYMQFGGSLVLTSMVL